jgi:hypothetical protein
MTGTHGEQVPANLCVQLFLGLAGGTADLVAGMLRHGDETLAFTGPVTFAGIFFGLAIVMPLAFIDTETMHLRFLACLHGCHGEGGEQGCCGCSERNTGDFFAVTHDELLKRIRCC